MYVCVPETRKHCLSELVLHQMVVLVNHINQSEEYTVRRCLALTALHN